MILKKPTTDIKKFCSLINISEEKFLKFAINLETRKYGL